MEPILDDEMLQVTINSFKNEKFLRGKSVEKFEEEFARFIETKFAIAVNSGTSALLLSLIAMGVKEGDYVVTTPATFIATANSILCAGSKPLFADISLKTYNLDPLELEKVIQQHKSKVKAIIPVHLYGHPCKMGAILDIAEKYDLYVLEDACQAHGATYNNKKVGSLGIAGAFSFYPSKNMTVCGDGGMVTTNDEEFANRIRSLRDVGRRKGESYLHVYVGYSARMSSVNAAIGRVQLNYLEVWNRRRRELARSYKEKLEGVGDIILPPTSNAEIKPAWHLYVIRTQYRDSLRKFLWSRNIQCGVHYPIPVHLQPPYRRLGFTRGMCPNAEKWAKAVVSLPLHPSLSDKEIEYVIACIKEFYRKGDQS